jgi:hypothetical protein
LEIGGPYQEEASWIPALQTQVAVRSEIGALRECEPEA